MQFGSLRMAGNFVLISALLHVIGVIFAGFAGPSLFFLGVAVIYALMGLGLRRGLPYLRYLAFIIMLVGIVAAIATLGRGLFADWVLWGIVLADLFAALALFINIWRRS